MLCLAVNPHSAHIAALYVYAYNCNGYPVALLRYQLSILMWIHLTTRFYKGRDEGHIGGGSVGSIRV